MNHALIIILIAAVLYLTDAVHMLIEAIANAFISKEDHTTHQRYEIDDEF